MDTTLFLLFISSLLFCVSDASDVNVSSVNVFGELIDATFNGNVSCFYLHLMVPDTVCATVRCSEVDGTRRISSDETIPFRIDPNRCPSNGTAYSVKMAYETENRTLIYFPRDFRYGWKFRIDDDDDEVKSANKALIIGLTVGIVIGAAIMVIALYVVYFVRGY